MATAASTLITRCLDNLSRASTGTTRSGTGLATRALDWLNTTQMKISRMNDFSEMYRQTTISTVASQKAYAFSTGYKTVYDLVLVDGFSSVKLECILPQHFDKRIPYPENYTQRRPRWYVPAGATFELYPIPATVYSMKLRHTIWPTTITSTTSTVSYDTMRDDILVAGMTAEGFRYLQMYEDANYWDAQFIASMKSSIAADEHMVDWNPVGRGFNSAYSSVPIGEYWNQPYTMGNP